MWKTHCYSQDFFHSPQRGKPEEKKGENPTIRGQACRYVVAGNSRDYSGDSRKKVGFFRMEKNSSLPGGKSPGKTL